MKIWFPKNRQGVLRFFAAVSLLGGLAAGGFVVTLPNVSRLRQEDPPSTAFIESRRASLRSAGRSDRVERIWVPLGAISLHLRQAVVLAEDGNFFIHHGIDFSATWRAARGVWAGRGGGKPLRGGSTITQQLAKNLYLSPDRSYWRKFREAAIALSMERSLGKDRILEIYLNSIEWGERIYGAEAASRHYFGKAASGLSEEESALLAAMIPGPRRALNPALHPLRVSRRQKKILRMMRSGWGLPGRQNPAPPEPDLDTERDTTSGD